MYLCTGDSYYLSQEIEQWASQTSWVDGDVTKERCLLHLADDAASEYPSLPIGLPIVNACSPTATGAAVSDGTKGAITASGNARRLTHRTKLRPIIGKGVLTCAHWYNC